MDSQVVGTIITATSVFLASAVSAGTINLSRNVKQITKEMKEGFDRLENYHAKDDIHQKLYKFENEFIEMIDSEEVSRLALTIRRCLAETFDLIATEHIENKNFKTIRRKILNSSVKCKMLIERDFTFPKDAHDEIRESANIATQQTLQEIELLAKDDVYNHKYIRIGTIFLNHAKLMRKDIIRIMYKYNL